MPGFWYSMYIDGRITDLYSEAGWKTIKSTAIQ